MPANFTISVDPRRSLVRMTMGGFFSRDDIERFVAARREAHAMLLCPLNQHLTLNDLRDIGIQAQEVVSEFRELLAAPEYRSLRLAFVVGPTLARGQLMRALAGRGARCFSTVEAAEAWLISGNPADEALAIGMGPGPSGAVSAARR